MDSIQRLEDRLAKLESEAINWRRAARRYRAASALLLLALTGAMCVAAAVGRTFPFSHRSGSRTTSHPN